MPNLKEEDLEKLEEQYDIVDELIDEDKIIEAVQVMEKSWETLPEPKGFWDESYELVAGIITQSMDIPDYIKAKKWSKVLYKCDLERIDSGEREFFSGMIEYELKNYQSARHFFEKAQIKSDGRCWKTADDIKKYHNFFLKGNEANIRPTEFKEMLSTALSEISNNNFSYALSLLYDCLNIELDNASVHFNKGLCHFELNELDHATESFTRAYMLEGEEIFKNQNAKYFDFLKTKIDVVL